MAERHSSGGLSASERMHQRHFGAPVAPSRNVESNSAEAKRRQRAGIRSPGGRGSAHVVWQAPPRNGLPWKPYVYRGTGTDQYAHLYTGRYARLRDDEEEACA